MPKHTYRMSSVGGCPRALAAPHLGFEPVPEPDYLILAGREGSRHERWVIDDLEAGGEHVTDQQREVVLAFPTFELVGHIDGLVNGRVLEVKALGRFRWESFRRHGFEGFPEYAAQIACYMEALHIPASYLVKSRDTGQVLRQGLDEPPVPFSQVYERVLAVEVEVRKGKLPEADCSPSYRRGCPYRYLCVDAPLLPGPAPDLGGLEVMVQQWRKGKQLQEEAGTLVDEARDAFLTYLRGKELARAEVGGLCLTLVPASERVSYPAAVLKKTVPAELLARAEKREMRAEYLRITEEE